MGQMAAPHARRPARMGPASGPSSSHVEIDVEQVPQAEEAAQNQGLPGAGRLLLRHRRGRRCICRAARGAGQVWGAESRAAPWPRCSTTPLRLACMAHPPAAPAAATTAGRGGCCCCCCGRGRWSPGSLPASRRPHCAGCKLCLHWALGATRGALAGLPRSPPLRPLCMASMGLCRTPLPPIRDLLLALAAGVLRPHYRQPTSPLLRLLRLGDD